MNPLARWIEEKRDVADQLEEHGAAERAELVRKLVNEVERAVERHRNETLTIDEAAEESGYSKEGLRKMVREGRIPDSRPGGSGPHRIRRADLPKKPPPPPSTAEREGGQGEVQDRGSPAERLVSRA